MPSVAELAERALEHMPHRAPKEDEVPTTPASPTVETTEQENPRSERVKASMNMQRSDLDALKSWADAEDTTMTEIIRRALVVYRYLIEEADQGSKVLLQREGERDRELLIRAVR